ncbi:MAG: hypothetical protein QM630_06275 [Microbacterium sp.]
MKKKAGYVAAVFTAVLALVIGPAVAATADASANYYNGGYLRSSAYYNASKDRASTTDERNDGWGSRVRWELNAGGGGSKDDINGAGSTDYGYPSFGSSNKIRIKSGSVNNGVHIGDGAFSGWVNI